MINNEEVEGRTASCANEQLVPVMRVGSVRLVTDALGRSTSVWLHDMLFAPGFVSCIISVSRLVAAGVSLLFDG